MKKITKAYLFVTASLMSGAITYAQKDRQEGWIIQETEQGLVKVPRKQYFSFDGYSVKGEAYTPSQGILDQRPLRRNRSLIPERKSFKREALSASGYMKR